MQNILMGWLATFTAALVLMSFVGRVFFAVQPAIEQYWHSMCKSKSQQYQEKLLNVLHCIFLCLIWKFIHQHIRQRSSALSHLTSSFSRYPSVIQTTATGARAADAESRICSIEDSLQHPFLNNTIHLKTVPKIRKLAGWIKRTVTFAYVFRYACDGHQIPSIVVTSLIRTTRSLWKQNFKGKIFKVLLKLVHKSFSR